MSFEERVSQVGKFWDLTNIDMPWSEVVEELCFKQLDEITFDKLKQWLMKEEWFSSLGKVEEGWTQQNGTPVFL